MTDARKDIDKVIADFLLTEYSELRQGIGARLERGHKTTVQVFSFSGALLAGLATLAASLKPSSVSSGVLLAPYTILVPFAFHTAAHSWSVTVVAQYLADNIETPIGKLAASATSGSPLRFRGFERYLRGQRALSWRSPIRRADVLDRFFHVFAFLSLAGLSTFMVCAPRSFGLPLDPPGVAAQAAAWLLLAFITVPLGSSFAHLLRSGCSLRSQNRPKIDAQTPESKRPRVNAG